MSARITEERLAEIRLDCADDGIGWESGRELLDEIDALRAELAEEHVAFEDLQECAEKLVDRAEAAEATAEVEHSRAIHSQRRADFADARVVKMREALSISDTALAVATGMIPDEDWDEDMEGSKAQWIARVLRQMDSALKDGHAEPKAEKPAVREVSPGLFVARESSSVLLALAGKPAERRYTLAELELAWVHDDESWYEFSASLTGAEE